MTAARRYDAVVVGGGPGGALAAYELGRRGAQTLLVEKHALPRDKPCGGGLTAKIVDVLPFSVQPVVERTITAVDLSWRLSDSTVLAGNAPLIYMVRRCRFDQFLVQRALATGNVTLVEGRAVTGVDPLRTGFSVRTAQEAFLGDHLIGADGASGCVAPALGLMRDRRLMPAMESELAVEPAVAEYWHDRVGLDLGSLRGSYGWVFPKDDHLNVGAGCFTDRTAVVRALRTYARTHLERRIAGTPRVIAQRGFVLPLRRVGAPIQQGRAMLVGDAAGLVEGFTGEGIYWAVRSGLLAARAILEGAGTPRYQERIDRELMPDLYAARRWAHVYLWWPRSCYTLPRRVPAVWRTVQKLLRGERGFAQLKQRLGAFGFIADLLPASLD